MIPKNISEVSPAWLSEVLGHPVTDFTPAQIGQGVGIMGDIFSTRINYADEAQGPSSVVVKLPSCHEENRAQGVALGMFEAEVRFYNEMAGQVTTGLPKIYRAEIESGTADFIIVMEDLSGLYMVEQIAGMSAEEAHRAVTVLAHIHATWWNKTQGDDLVWIPSMIGDRITMVDQLLIQLLPPFLANFGARLPAGGSDIYEAFTGNYLKINQALAARSPWTLAHQDFRVENMLFHPSEDQVVVIDWQGIGRGPGAYDLGYLLGGSMATDLRRAHEGALTRTYHDTLTSLGIADYSYEQLWQDYAHAQLMGGLATSMVTGGGMDLSNDRGVELIATMAGRHAQAAMDHDGLSILNNL